MTSRGVPSDLDTIAALEDTPTKAEAWLPCQHTAGGWQENLEMTSDPMDAPDNFTSLPSYLNLTIAV
jgi:hypothetical protein